MKMAYVLQLDPDLGVKSWQFGVRWPGYWSGVGYVEKSKDAVKFRSKRDAERVMLGTFVGLNGCMKIVRTA
jgi:hypothetical protein